jgi:hypothetical protein
MRLQDTAGSRVCSLLGKKTTNVWGVFPRIARCQLNLSMMSFEQLTASPAIAHHTTEYVRTVDSMSSTPSMTAVNQPCRPNGVQAKETANGSIGCDGNNVSGRSQPGKAT